MDFNHFGQQAQNVYLGITATLSLIGVVFNFFNHGKNAKAITKVEDALGKAQSAADTANAAIQAVIPTVTTIQASVHSLALNTPAPGQTPVTVNVPPAPIYSISAGSSIPVEQQPSVQQAVQGDTNGIY